MKKFFYIILVLMLTSLACSATNNILSDATDGILEVVEDQISDFLPQDLLTQIPDDLLDQIPDLLTQMPDDFLTQIPEMLTHLPQDFVPSVGTSTPSPQTGSISGTLSYPSEMIPAMTIIARNLTDPSHFYTIYTVDHQAEFIFNHVDPGSYSVIAYASIGADIAGAFSQAVPCGLLYTCEDHSLIPVVVVAGEDTPNIQPWDWYAPEGTFPPNPVP